MQTHMYMYMYVYLHTICVYNRKKFPSQRICDWQLEQPVQVSLNIVWVLTVLAKGGQGLCQARHMSIAFLSSRQEFSEATFAKFMLLLDKHGEQMINASYHS